MDRAQLVKKLIQAEQSKAFEQQRDLLLNANDTLKARVVIKEMQIVNLNAQISDYKNIVSSKDAIISTQGEQRKIWEANITDLNKQIRRLTTKAKLTALAGLVTTGIAVFFYMSK